MTILCSIVGHRAPATKVWNDGLYFGCCPRCGDQLIRGAQEGRWRGLPERLRVVWKPSGPHALDWYVALGEAPARRPLRARTRGAVPTA